MALDVDTMISDLRDTLGVDTDDLPNVDALRLLNRSFWEIAAKFDFRAKDAEYSFSTAIGDNDYTVPADMEAMQNLVIQDLNTDAHMPLTRMSIVQYESEYVNKTDTRGKPTFYFRRNDEVILYPTPDEVYSMTMYYQQNLADLVSLGTVSIPQEWGEAILYGGIYRGFLKFNDLNRSSYFRNMQATTIETMIPVESKEEEDSRLAGLNVIWSSDPNYPGRRRLWK